VVPTVLEDLVRLCVELAGYGTCGQRSGAGTGGGDAGTGTGTGTGGNSDRGDSDRGSSGTGPNPPTARGRDALEQEIIRRAVALMSGPGGLASFLRRRELGGRLPG
jgi:hypothetical protein